MKLIPSHVLHPVAAATWQAGSGLRHMKKRSRGHSTHTPAAGVLSPRCPCPAGLQSLYCLKVLIGILKLEADLKTRFSSGCK